MRYLCSAILGLSLLAALAFTAIAADEPAKPTAPPTLAQAKTVAAQGRYLAVITLESGKKIELVLEGALMPYTVANFINLAQSKYYDGVTFHRVEKDPAFALIQGGDPKGDGTGGPGYQIRLEISPFLSHRKGAISMARTPDPNSAGSQFFITASDCTGLDAGYAVFGWVKSGQDEVSKVKENDKMKTVTVAPYDGKEAIPIAPKK